jgi:hypothetical protein
LGSLLNQAGKVSVILLLPMSRTSKSLQLESPLGSCPSILLPCKSIVFKAQLVGFGDPGNKRGRYEKRINRRRIQEIKGEKVPHEYCRWTPSEQGVAELKNLMREVELCGGLANYAGFKFSIGIF